MRQTIIYNVYIFLTIGAAGCGHRFLDLKEDKKQVVPNSVSDYQAILDNSIALTNASSHELGIIGSDEYYVTKDVWEVLSRPYQRNGYIWAEDIHEGASSPDWDNAYRRIQLTNIVLDGMKNVKPADGEKEQYDNVKGSALFFRGFNHFQLSQLFCKQYVAETAATDLGIPLRVDSDLTVKSTRASIANTYAQIMSDLKEAADLLPESQVIKYRPSKAAALALIARVALQKADYEMAEMYSSLALSLANDLMDFNDLDLDDRYVFTSDYEQNTEVLFKTNLNNIAITASARFNADTNLLASYEPGDLRPRAYFFEHASGRLVFKGSYTGGASFFTGLATDEVFLIRAECLARRGAITDALEDLNLLRAHRFEKTADFVLDSNDPDDVLNFVLEERRKELLLRGVRWGDLRRLNLEPGTAKTLMRSFMGVFYELQPNSNRYVWPIPDTEILLSGLDQNIR